MEAITTKNIQSSKVTKYNELIHALPVAILIVNPKGIIINANAPAKELLNTKLLGMSWVEVSVNCFSPQSDDGHEISLKDGKRVQLLTNPINSGEGQLVVLVDITESRMLQQKIYHEKRLAQLGKMLATLAHQIRTPLASALLYSTTLKSQLDVDNSRRMCEKIINSIKQLESHINDILLFAKSGKQIAQVISLETLFHEAIKIHGIKKLYPQVTLDICCTAPTALLKVNMHALVGAIGNLLINAIEATANQETVKVSLAGELYEKKVYIIVKDNGKGISEKDISKILEPFYTTKAQGTGLGLAVVNSVVKMHDGELLIESEINHGTSIKIILPIFTCEKQL